VARYTPEVDGSPGPGRHDVYKERDSVWRACVEDRSLAS
jgi:hypothetical protein